MSKNRHPDQYVLVIRGDEIRSIYSDDLDLSVYGDTEIVKASHIIPRNGKWYADMNPVASGVVLGPFNKREEARRAEINYINENIL